MNRRLVGAKSSYVICNFKTALEASSCMMRTEEMCSDACKSDTLHPPVPGKRKD